MIYTIAGVFAALLLIKFVLNLTRLLRLKRYLTRYKDWYSTKDEKFLESRAQILRLIRDADVEDGRISVTQHVGGGNLQVFQASVLDNFPSRKADMAAYAQRLFLEAIGTYRARMWESINPLFWIEFLIYLPRTVLNYLNLSTEGTLARILQVLWWIVGIVGSIALALYPTEIRDFIEGLF